MISVYDSFFRISISIVLLSFIVLINQSQLLFVLVGGDLGRRLFAFQVLLIPHFFYRAVSPIRFLSPHPHFPIHVFTPSAFSHPCFIPHSQFLILTASVRIHVLSLLTPQSELISMRKLLGICRQKVASFCF